MNLKEAYSYSVQFLEANNIDEADFKALNAVCYVAGINLSEYKTHTEDFIITKRLADFLWRLKSGEPLQYIIGKWDFWNSEFYVGEGVLIPRPETEELVELALNILKNIDNPTVIDLCSGTGCIGISIAKEIKSANVYCIEKSSDAIKYLKKNAEGITNVTVIQDDINNDIDLHKADVIISNPPYIRSAEISTLQEEVLKEPKIALDGGEDGLDFYRIINNKWKSKLKQNGTLILEIGNEQGETIKDVLTNFSDVTIKKDLYGNDRIVIVKD